MALDHIVKFERGYDCITFKCVRGSDACAPGSGGSHGRHGMVIRFLSKGPHGAAQFILNTGWMPQSVKAGGIGTEEIRILGLKPYPVGLGYHSKTRMHDGQEPIDDGCEFCDGRPCYYYPGSNGSDAMYALVNGGDEALWRFLDAYYMFLFCGGEYLGPTEYEMPIR